MNANAKAWVADLRSGLFQQTREGCLSERNKETGEIVGHCCLGVACVRAVEAGIITAREGRPDPYNGSYSNTVSYDSDERRADSMFLPPAVMDWLGMRSADGSFKAAPTYGDYAEWTNLAAINDGGATFEEIADLIEKHADELFVS